MRRVLITGANGFLGSHVAGRLAEEGFRVRGACRSVAAVRSGVAGCHELVATGDLGPDTDWTRALSEVDTVVHLAARVHQTVDAAVEPLVEYRHVNAAGTLRLARAAVEMGIRRFIFVSTVKVIGETSGDGMIRETDVPRPIDPYGLSKWEAEQVLQELQRTTPLEIVVLRPPLMYGPRVKANFLRLFEAVARGVPFPISRVRNRRSLLYVGNFADVIASCVTHPDAPGQPLLVADSAPRSTVELLRAIGDAIGRPARIFDLPLSWLRLAGRITGQQGAIGRLTESLVVDAARLREQLHWRPRYSFEEGIEATARWFLQGKP